MKHYIYGAILSAAAMGSAGAHSVNWIWCISAWKSNIWWQQFFTFRYFSKKKYFPL